MTSENDTPHGEDARPPAPSPDPRFFDVAVWAEANSLGINAVYEYLRRERDPLPHIRQGRRKLVDDELAVAWMRRTFGVRGAAS
jgi:hypothetical protein